METLTAQELLARESRVSYGPVADAIGAAKVEVDRSLLADDQFLLRTSDGLSFHYRKGSGVTIDRSPQADPVAEKLWLNGSVYAAIASINGFLPIHASAVDCHGEVVAFTGPSGAGKSTLAAALGKRGLPMFCDDTLVLDISDMTRIRCLPGHKRLKLLPDALELTGAAREEPVGAETGKFYATPAGGDFREPLPLGLLVFLEEGAELAYAEIAGAERFARMHDDHYTAHLFAQAQGGTLTERFSFRAGLARAVAMARFVRPHDSTMFDRGADMIAARLAGKGTPR